MARTRVQGGTVRQLRNGRWAAYVLTATRGRESVEKGTTWPDKQSAQKALNKAKALVELGLWESRGEPDEQPKASARVDTFGRFGERYAANTPRLKPRSRENYFSLLRTTLSRFKDMPLDQITEGAVNRWWRDSADKPVNRRNAYSAMRRIMKHAVHKKIIYTSPCTIEGAFANVAEDRPDYDRDDFEKVLGEVDPYYRPILRALIASSGRLGELIGLNVTDWDGARFSITKQGRGTSTKTGKTRKVRLLADGIEAVDEYLSKYPAIGATPLFRGVRGGRLNPHSLRKAWDDGCEAAGYSNFHMHDLRHVAGTEAAAAGLSLKDIMERLGHTTVAAAMRYQHSSAKRQEEAAMQIDAHLAAKRA